MAERTIALEGISVHQVTSALSPLTSVESDMRARKNDGPQR